MSNKKITEYSRIATGIAKGYRVVNYSVVVEKDLFPVSAMQGCYEGDR
jgi:hypothetical protein